jgi:hypothetical protein
MQKKAKVRYSLRLGHGMLHAPAELRMDRSTLTHYSSALQRRDNGVV